jgi:hypothetical protein
MTDIVQELLADISPLRDLASTERNARHYRAIDEIQQLRFENKGLSLLVTNLSEKVLRLKLALNGISEE